MGGILHNLGFDSVSAEGVVSVLGLVAILSSLAAWICDAIMRESGFGVPANAVVLFSGAVAALAAWQRWGEPVASTDAAVLLGLCVAASFGLILALALLRRVAS